MAIPTDPVLSVEDARAHLHSIIAAVGEGQEFLVGPRRRPVARLTPAAARNSAGVAPEGPEVALSGHAAASMLALAGDSIGFALAEGAASGAGLASPEAAVAALQGLDEESLRLLTDAAWEAFRAAEGDPEVTRQDIHDVLTR